jgi:hypothetical protein
MSMNELPARGRRVPDPSFTVNEFCAAERMSRGALYEFWRTGRGPKYYLVGSHRRITATARAQWQAEREAEALAGNEVV